MYVYGNSVFPIRHGNSESGSKYVIYIPYEENFLSYRILNGYKMKKRCKFQQFDDYENMDVKNFSQSHLFS